MAAIIKSCNGDCAGASAACENAYKPCPTGYYCAFGNDMGFDPEEIETACLSGVCVNVDDSSDIYKISDNFTYWCHRCDPGYLIVTWKEEYKTKTGTEDCVFLLDFCPQICDPYIENSVECLSADSCYACEDSESECSIGPGMTFISTCTAEQQRACNESYTATGSNEEEVISGRPKGLVVGQASKKCCGCDPNLCPGCPNPCAGSCLDTGCPANWYCSTSTIYCGECVLN